MRRLLPCWEWIAAWIERLTPLFVIVGVLVLAGLVIEVLGQQNTLGQQQRALARQSQQSREQRADSIRISCEQTNARNRNTIHEYDQRIAKLAPKLPPAQRKQLTQSRDFTVGLINALDPVEDCTARVRLFTSPHPQRP